MSMSTADIDRLEAVARRLLRMVDRARIAAAKPPAKRGRPAGSKNVRSRAKRTTASEAGEMLGPAERRVFELMCKGLNTEAIAAKVKRSASTIKNQRARIFKRFDVHSQAELLERFSTA